MHKIIFTLIAFSLSAIAASPFNDFSGSYHITGAPIHDPQEELSLNTHIYLSIGGQPAREMYELMEGEPKFSACGEDHYLKSSGNVGCSFYPIKNEYSCDFSINIKAGKIDPSGWC